MDDTALAAFHEAVDLAAEVLADDAVARCWQDASCVDGFTVGGLASHLYVSLRRLEASLDEPLPEPATEVGLAEFYGANRVDVPADRDGGIHALIRDDAERRAADGPSAVRARFAKLTARLRERLPAEPPDRPVPVIQIPGGVAPLPVYLASRVVELVVHSDDLAVSVDLPLLRLPAAPASVVIEVCVELARARHGDLGVVRAFTRAERAGPDALRVL